MFDDKDITAGSLLVLKERMRQQSEEGHTVESDMDQLFGELGQAAACYASPTPLFTKEDITSPDKGTTSYFYSDPWPWSMKEDKRSSHNRIKQLAIAGALCAAEIDRLLAQEKFKKGETH